MINDLPWGITIIIRFSFGHEVVSISLFRSTVLFLGLNSSKYVPWDFAGIESTMYLEVFCLECKI